MEGATVERVRVAGHATADAVVWQQRDRGVTTTVHFYDDGRVEAEAYLRSALPRPYGSVPFEFRRCEVDPRDVARATAAVEAWRNKK